MEAKLIYPKWVGGKAQIEFPKSPITGQIFKFIDQSKLDWEFWEVQTYFYTGTKWLKTPPTRKAKSSPSQAELNQSTMEPKDKIDLYKDFYEEYVHMRLKEEYDKIMKKPSATISSRMPAWS